MQNPFFPIRNKLTYVVFKPPTAVKYKRLIKKCVSAPYEKQHYQQGNYGGYDPKNGGF